MFLHPFGTRGVKPVWLWATLAMALALLLVAETAEGSVRSHTLRYWTPQRMRSARPLDLVLGRDGASHLRLGRPAPAASASFLGVAAPEAPPYSVNGRVFIRVRDQRGYCSGTAIDSPTRQLVLTAGHCVNAGVEYHGNLWYRDLLFVPAYSGGRTPFGTFAAQRDKVFAAPQWTNHGNSNFDVGAFLTAPNAQGVNVADAVGGGAAIALDRSRQEEFATFGCPHRFRWMKSCAGSYVGDDRRTFLNPGPPTLGVGCQWVPGASGGGWLIEGGTEINGLTSYGILGRLETTYGPYFSRENVGKLVAGL